MIEIQGDLWDFHAEDQWIVIPTNGVVRHDGACIMGRGLALEAKHRFISLPYMIGAMVRMNGNHVFEFPEFRIYSFPTKHHWRLPSLLSLIEQSAKELRGLVESLAHPRKVFLPLVGCGQGKLGWSIVRPVLENHLDERFTVIHWKS